MELNDYPHFFLAEDGRLCCTGQHCPGFQIVLWDALLHLGYDRDAPIYRCRLSKAHGLDRCEVSVMIPFDPTETWSGSIIGSETDTGVEMMVHITLTSVCEDRSIIGSETDTGVEMMVHITLTSVCEDRLAATAAQPIVLLLIQNQENSVWQQCLEAVSDLEGPHFHVGMTLFARYAQYLFNLQHNTARTGMQQCMCLTAYEEHTTATSCELEAEV
jgi:hypothetical protein